MTHIKGEQKNFQDIEVGGHYILEHKNGRQEYCLVVQIDNKVHYYVLEVYADGLWGPYTLSIPYTPPGEFTSETISGGKLKVFVTDPPIPKRRRRISR
jgi:hypothetical protein